jgi:class 3 adenylate cyclase/tetratricopeptide (TPR) repeat protein
VVTVLFADLVGFTSRAERLDPEDVRAFLSPYYARLRTELERFGGTVEKFIGDAVMAVFGAPVAHEDDPERAVRAALAIRDWVNDQDAELQLRIAVNTGEALVYLGARTSEGEGMVSGDVVNTAARLQAAAPVNGILVGEVTHRATSPVIDYRDSNPITAKGKAEPVPAWEALEARARFGVDLSRSGGPLVGREHELRVVVDSLARVRRERSPQLVTIVGVPGIGKSRLVAELFREIDADPSELVLWRQGRSLPYGDGVTFWALAEMVKAQAGILESDSADRAEQKLRTAVGEVIPDASDAQWVESLLRPLVGLGISDRRGSQSEAFAAWRRFFEGLAEQHPLTLIFEDMQWADDSLLDFVEYLIDWSGDVPILVLCTTRPEMLEHRPAWGGGKRNATTLSLSPLSEDDTARLISSLGNSPVLAAETQQALVERAGGNPLYAEQYVRMQAERGRDAATLLPESVQGIIAARLDALSDEQKQLIQNAAVVGKVFWLGSVADVAGLERPSVEMLLHALERKEFVQRVRRSSVAGEVEYAFLHILVRDVAYGQIPRGQRAEKHRLAAEWLEALGRPEDHAEMLAHHYRSAVELMRAAGQPIGKQFAGRVLTSLREAGDRAVALNAHANAIGFYEAALELAADGSVERAQMLYKLGSSRLVAEQLDPALMVQARDELLAIGDRETAAEAELGLGEYMWLTGERDRAFEHLEAARNIVEGLPLSRAKAHVAASTSRYMMLAARSDESIRSGREALAMAEQLGDGELRANALNNIGVSRVDTGDFGGIDDLETSRAIAREANAPRETCRAMGNLAATMWEIGRLAEARALWEEAHDHAARFGQATFERWFRAQPVVYEYALGRWDRALVAADEFIAEVEAGSPHYLASMCYCVRALIRMQRGEVESPIADAERALRLSRQAKDPQNHLPTVAACAHVFRETGDRARASALADEFLTELRTGRGIGFGTAWVHLFAWTAAGFGRGADLIDALPAYEYAWLRAARAFAAGDLRRAADITGEMGAVSEEARDRLWLARILVEQGRRTEADAELQRALTFYRSVGATRYIQEAEALRAASA